MSRTLVLMVIVLAGTTADARVRLNIVRSAYCGIDCPVDAIERATLEVAGSRRHGARGIVGRIRIKGAVEDGRPATVRGLIGIVPLQYEPDVCTGHILLGIDVVDGKASYDFTGEQLGRAEDRPPGTILPVCGGARIIPPDMTGYAPIFEAGHVLGERRGRRSRLELLPLPDCGAGCPVDHVRKGWIEVSGSGGRNGDELAVKIRLRGALRVGQKVDLQDLHAGFLFHPSNILEFCPFASVPDLAVRNGRSERNAIGPDVATDWPLGSGTVFSFCSGAWIASDPFALDNVLQGGIVVGADPDPAAREP